MVYFDNSLLLSFDWSQEGSSSVHYTSFSATYLEQHCLHSWRFANSTSWIESSWNSPAGNRKLSYRNKVKLKSVMFSSDTARPCGKYGKLTTGSTSEALPSIASERERVILGCTKDLAKNYCRVSNPEGFETCPSLWFTYNSQEEASHASNSIRYGNLQLQACKVAGRKAETPVCQRPHRQWHFPIRRRTPWDRNQRPWHVSVIWCIFTLTNVPVDETIEIITERAFENDWFNKEHNLNITKSDLIATNNHLFQFEGDLFEQTDRVAMGSPLGPLKANTFMCNLEKQLEARNLPDACLLQTLCRWYA